MNRSLQSQLGSGSGAVADADRYRVRDDSVSDYWLGNLAFHWHAGAGPSAPAAIERDGVLVAPFLEVVRRQGAAVAATAVQHQGGGLVGNPVFDVALDDPFAEVNGTLGAACGPLAVLAGVDQHVRNGFREHFAIAVEVDFLDARLRFVDQRRSEERRVG